MLTPAAQHSHHEEMLILLLTLTRAADAAPNIRDLLAKVKQNEDRLATELEKFGYNERIDPCVSSKNDDTG